MQVMYDKSLTLICILFLLKHITVVSSIIKIKIKLNKIRIPKQNILQTFLYSLGQF